MAFTASNDRYANYKLHLQIKIKRGWYIEIIHSKKIKAWINKYINC